MSSAKRRYPVPFAYGVAYQFWLTIDRAVWTGAASWDCLSQLRRLNKIAQSDAEFYPVLHEAAAFYRRWSIYSRKHVCRPTDIFAYVRCRVDYYRSLSMVRG